ncbi:MAG: VOC family protein [Vicinamibacteria bacterium]|nr:VOC family protein [Vicinamibacteria bacterium]
MSVTSMREITIGVRDLTARAALLESGLGLTVLRTGLMTSSVASRLFDAHTIPRAALMGRPDVEGSPRIRLVEVLGALHGRERVGAPGPLGTGFTTTGISKIHARLQGLGVRFLSDPLLLAPPREEAIPGAPPGPRRYEAFGRFADGDFVVLIERVGADTAYGTLTSDSSEPLHASFVVTNLNASLHFMREVLEHETLLAESCSGPPFDELLGRPEGASFRFAMSHRPGFVTGRTIFMEFEKRLEPMTHTPGLGPGICRLRYDTTDLHATLARVPGGGGSLVRGPASVDDPVLGQGLVAMVRSPFGVLIELWQTT